MENAGNGEEADLRLGPERRRDLNRSHHRGNAVTKYGPWRESKLEGTGQGTWRGGEGRKIPRGST